VSDAIVEASANPDDSAVVVGAGSRFQGLLAFWGLARIEGGLDGEVAADGTLEVGPDAAVRARIEVDALVVEGLVEGEVIARERVEIRAGGRVTAAIRTPRLQLADGGSLEGRVTMTGMRGGAAGAGSKAASAA